MAQRTVCLCDGKYIGIETIFTVINGQQINIPEKIKWLRAKSQSNELFCPCGCGANLILVAGERNLREQHFRLKGGIYENDCHFVIEGKKSVDSKIVLKCWLDEKLKTNDVETRIPINFIGDTNRKYELSFLSRIKNIAISYSYERANLLDEKFDILKANSNGARLIYIINIMNSSSNGQYPEALMKIQDRQGYCLMLDVEDASYSDANMYAVFFVRDNDGLWQEVRLAEGRLSDYTIGENGQLLYKNELLSTLLDKQTAAFEEAMRAEKIGREEEKKRRDDDFKRNMKANFAQQQTQIRDAAGNRWVKCEYCGLIAKESEFVLYGGKNHVNLGICKSCSSKEHLRVFSV